MTLPPQLFIVASAVVQYIGAGIAVYAFSVMSPEGVAWWRLFVGAVVLSAWRKPWRARLSSKDLMRSAIFGAVLGGMNICFYEAIARLPLGTAVSLEFLGPVAVAVIRGQGWASRVAAVLACAGVVSIGGLGLDLHDSESLIGVVWVLGAALAWAFYILLGQKIASQRSAVTNLALGCVAGAVIYLPFAGVDGVAAFTDWHLLVAVIAVGLLSSVLPFTLEALAMTRLTAATFALFTAMLPATSAVVGALMLHQVPGVWELAGLALISVAVWIASPHGTVASKFWKFPFSGKNQRPQDSDGH